MPAPRQYMVRVTAQPEDRWLLQWDGLEDVVETGDFFPPQVLDGMLLQSLRCLLAIQNYTDPTADGVIADIRNRGGIQTPCGPVYVSRIEQEETGDFRIWYGFTAADASYSLGFTRDDLDQTPRDGKTLAWQIGAFLKLKGFSALTPEAIASVQSAKFRGW